MTVLLFTQQQWSWVIGRLCGCLIEGSDDRSPPERPDTQYCSTLYHLLLTHKMWVSSMRAEASPVHFLVKALRYFVEQMVRGTLP